jgi:uncharacterized protein YcbX
MAKIQSIYRYPIKGLSPEPLAQVALSPGETLPGDRLYAIENGPSPFDPVHRPYLPKQHFLMLMRNESLAVLRTSFDLATHTLTIVAPTFSSPCKGEDGARGASPFPSPLVGEGWEGGREGKSLAWTGAENPSASVDVLPTPTPDPSPQEGGEEQAAGEKIITADLRTAAGRAAIEAFFAHYCADELRGPPRVLHAPGHSFSDVARKVVSFINLASVGAIEDMVGIPVDPLRFRGNVYVEGWPAWSELDLVDKDLIISPPPAGGRTANEVRQEGVSAARTPTRLKIVKRIVRCAATNVDPTTGARDLNIPRTLMQNLGHADCGIYAEVIEGGEIAAGDEILIADA